MVTNWATSLSHYKSRGFRRFVGAQLSFCVFLCPVICQFSKNCLFRKQGAKMLFFSENLRTHQKGQKWLIVAKLFFDIFVFSLLFFFCFLFCFLFFVWGFKGQVRWPKGPPHLALNPPYLVFFVFFFCFAFFFPFFAFQYTKNLVFPQKRAFCVYFWVSPFVSPLPFLASPFFYFSFSVSLSLSLSLLFLSFFLPCLSFLLSFGSCFSLFLSFYFFFPFVSWKEQHQNIQLQFCLHQTFLFFWFPVLFFLSSPFFLSLLFPDFKLCFLFNINVFGFKTNNLTKQFFWSKGGLQQNVFSLWICVLQNVKSYRFFGAILLQKWPLLMVTNWATLMVTNWATLMVTNWATFVPL